MSKSRHTEAQMIGALKQLEAWRKAEDVAQEVGVSCPSTPSTSGRQSTGMDVSKAQERKLVADLSLDKEALQSVIRKNGWSS